MNKSYHPFEIWIDSEKGMRVMSNMTCIEMPYRKNILYWAYQAGLERSQDNEQIKMLQRENTELRVELYYSKKLVRALTKRKNKV